MRGIPAPRLDAVRSFLWQTKSSGRKRYSFPPIASFRATDCCHKFTSVLKHHCSNTTRHLILALCSAVSRAVGRPIDILPTNVALLRNNNRAGQTRPIKKRFTTRFPYDFLVTVKTFPDDAVFARTFAVVSIAAVEQNLVFSFNNTHTSVVPVHRYSMYVLASSCNCVYVHTGRTPLK